MTADCDRRAAEIGIRKLIEAARPAARRHIQATLQKAGGEVAGHGKTADQNPNIPFEPDHASAGRRHKHREYNPADRLGTAEEGPAIDELRLPSRGYEK